MLFEGRRAVGVRTAAGEHRADALVINADFAHAMTRLVPDHLRRRWTDEKIAKKKFSCSTFMLYLGIEGRYDDLPHHTIYCAADYAANLADIETRHVLSDDPSFYVQNACVTDPTLAPAGHSTLYVLAPVTHQHPNVDWKRGSARVPRRLLRATGEARHRAMSRGASASRRWSRRPTGKADYADPPRRDVQPGPHPRPDAPPPAAEPLRGPRRRLPGRRRHPPGSGLPVIYESARITSAAACSTDLGACRSRTGGARGAAG